MTILVEEARVVSNFALTHFNAAKHFSIKTREIETENAGQPYGNYWEEISIYCASSLMTAAASLEALINELFITPGELRHQVDNFDIFFWGAENGTGNRRKGLERKPALEKYKKAVELLGKPQLSRTDNQYKTAELLIAFRNYLIHFKPLWDSELRNDELEQRLIGLFKLSPYADEGASFLEMKCMSAGCSAWAVQTVVDFIDYFRARSGLEAKKLDAFIW